MIESIDYKKCIGCGRCVGDCVNRYIYMCDDETSDKYGKPVIKERGRCINCGHCLAVCPNDAITMKPDSLLDSGRFENDSLLKVMAEKRTVRMYKKGSHIEKDKLERIIFAGNTAPTEENRRSARIIMIKDKLGEIYNIALNYLVDRVQKAGTIDPIYSLIMELDKKRDEVLWNAEYLVVLAGTPKMITDAVISAERMQLAAEVTGIGTAYNGNMKEAINKLPSLRETIGLRKNEDALVCFTLGYTDIKYYRSAVKNNRKVVFL